MKNEEANKLGFVLGDDGVWRYIVLEVSKELMEDMIKETILDLVKKAICKCYDKIDYNIKLMNTKKPL